MTVLEMLDALEGQIAALRGERARLASALESAEERLKTVDQPAPRAAKKRRKPKKSAKAAKSRTKPSKQKQPEIAAAGAEPAVEPPKSAPPKRRQALGRGLSQLLGAKKPAQAPADAELESVLPAAK
jgi:hypothetical protein